MPNYVYKVRDKEGKIVTGTMTANDGRELRKRLDERDFFIVEYYEKKSKKDFLALDLNLFSHKVALKDVTVFSWQLYTMLDAGMTLTNTLKIIETQTQNPALKSAVNAVCRRVEEGSTFADALGEHPKVFSALYVQMVAAGEVGGVLDEMLKRLALYYEYQDEIKEKIKAAMTYPVILLVVSACVIIFLLVYILPRFAAIFADMGVVVPLPTKILLGISAFITANWYILVLAPVMCYVALRSYAMTETGRYQIDKLKLRIPVVGDLLRKTIASRFTQTLSTLLAGGIPILTALDVVTDIVGNMVVTRAVKNISAMVGEGKSITQPLEESRIFPQMVVNMIRVGEETGSMDKMLEKVAHFYNREIDDGIRMFTKLIEPVLIVFMTFIIGAVAVSIFLPMSELMRGLH